MSINRTLANGRDFVISTKSKKKKCLHWGKVPLFAMKTNNFQEIYEEKQQNFTFFFKYNRFHLYYKTFVITKFLMLSRYFCGKT